MALLTSRFPRHIRMVVAEAGAEVVAGLLIYLTDRVQRAQYVFRCGGDDRARISMRLILHVASHPDYQRAWHDLGTSVNPLTEQIDAGVLLEQGNHRGARRDRPDLDVGARVGVQSAAA